MTARNLIAVVICATTLAAAIGGYLWYRLSALEPPTVILTGVDLAVAAAVEEARAAVRQSPRSGAAWGRLGMILYIHDFAPQALMCLAEAERLDRHNAHWPYYHGLALVQVDPEAAIAKWQRAVELCGDRPDTPRLRLAETLLAQGRIEEAEDQLRHTLERYPGHPRAHLGLARVAYERGELTGSLTHLGPATTSPFTQKAAYALLAEIHQQLGDKATAAVELRLEASLPPDPPWPDQFYEELQELKTGNQGVIDRAETLLKQGRVSEAITLLEERVQQAGDSYWPVWLWLGKARLQEGNYAAAEQALDKAARLAPASIETQFELGNALFEQGKIREAGLCFRKTIQLKPDHLLANYNLGHCLKRLGAEADAMEAFRAALRCYPSFADAHTNLGDLLVQKGQYAEALLHLRYALELNPEDARAKKLLQQVLGRVVIPAGLTMAH